MIHGTTQRIPVSTEPVGVEVYVDGEFVGVAPLELLVSRRKSYELVLRFGEQEKLILLERKVTDEGVSLLGLDSVPLMIGTVLILPSADGDCNLDSCLTNALLGIPLVTASVISILADVGGESIYTLNPGEVHEVFDIVEP